MPRSEVRLELAVDSLLRLPSLAQYSGRSGQASVAVSREGGVIIVEAGCDSLLRVAERYERTAAAWRERCEELSERREREEKRRQNPTLTLFAGFGAGLAAGVTVTTIIIKRRKNG